MNGQRFIVIDINTTDADVMNDLDKVISHDWQASAHLSESKTMRIMIKESDFDWWCKKTDNQETT